MKPVPENRLIVEGDDDKRLIPWLVEASGISWGTRSDCLAEIEARGGKTEVIRPSGLSTPFKHSRARRLGVILDADEDCASTWRQVRDLARRDVVAAELDIEVPDELPVGGWVAACARTGKRLGVWIMPDNVSPGMLETFLRYLVPDTGEALWEHARVATEGARGCGAPFNHPVHVDKANIHAWLAWQEPPGRQLHDAVKQRILRPGSPHAARFVRWFCELFEVSQVG